MGEDKAVIERISQPVYFLQPVNNDDISISDIWKRLISHKKLYLSIMLILLLIGSIGIGALYEKKFLLRTVLDIKTLKKDGVKIVIDTPGGVISKFENVLLPKLVRSAEEAPDASILRNTVARNPKGTDLVVIESSVPDTLVARFEGYHDQIAAGIMSDLEQEATFVRNAIRTAIARNLHEIEEKKTEQKILDQIRDERSVQIRGSSNDSQELLAALNNEISFKKDLIQTEIDLISARMVQLEYELEKSGPGVLQAATVEQRTGIPASVVYLIWIILSLLLASMLVLLVSLINKSSEDER